MQNVKDLFQEQIQQEKQRIENLKNANRDTKVYEANLAELEGLYERVVECLPTPKLTKVVVDDLLGYAKPRMVDKDDAMAKWEHHGIELSAYTMCNYETQETLNLSDREEMICITEYHVLEDFANLSIDVFLDKHYPDTKDKIKEYHGLD